MNIYSNLSMNFNLRVFFRGGGIDQWTWENKDYKVSTFSLSGEPGFSSTGLIGNLQSQPILNFFIWGGKGKRHSQTPLTVSFRHFLYSFLSSPFLIFLMFSFSFHIYSLWFPSNSFFILPYSLIPDVSLQLDFYSWIFPSNSF